MHKAPRHSRSSQACFFCSTLCSTKADGNSIHKLSQPPGCSCSPWMPALLSGCMLTSALDTHMHAHTYASMHTHTPFSWSRIWFWRQSMLSVCEACYHVYLRVRFCSLICFPNAQSFNNKPYCLRELISGNVFDCNYDPDTHLINH